MILKINTYRAYDVTNVTNEYVQKQKQNFQM